MQNTKGKNNLRPTNDKIKRITKISHLIQEHTKACIDKCWGTHAFKAQEKENISIPFFLQFGYNILALRQVKLPFYLLGPKAEHYFRHNARGRPEDCLLYYPF